MSKKGEIGTTKLARSVGESATALNRPVSEVVLDVLRLRVLESPVTPPISLRVDLEDPDIEVELVAKRIGLGLGRPWPGGARRGSSSSERVDVILASKVSDWAPRGRDAKTAKARDSILRLGTESHQGLRGPVNDRKSSTTGSGASADINGRTGRMRWAPNENIPVTRKLGSGESIAVKVGVLDRAACISVPNRCQKRLLRGRAGRVQLRVP